MKGGIDWKARIGNKSFWLSLSAALLLLAQAIAALFGYQWDFTVFGQQVAALINALFAVLAVLGVVADPTVEWSNRGGVDGE